VDAKCDKIVTELSRRRLRRSTFSSYSELFVESRQFQPTPPAFTATDWDYHVRVLPTSSASEN